MKKRLLSALLALVMVLAMLPAAAFAAAETDPGVSVTYHATEKTGTSVHYSGTFSPGYYSGSGTESDPYAVQTGAVLIGSKIYTSLGEALRWGTSFKLVGDDTSTISTDKGITIDVNGHSFTGGITMTKGGTLKISDSQYAGERKQGVGAITVDNSAGATALAASVELTNVSATSISVEVGGTGKITLTNAELSAGITMDGTKGYTNSKGDAVTTNAAQTVDIKTNSSVGGDVELTGKGSKATLSTGTITGSLTITGAQTAVDAGNRSTLGAVTLTASDDEKEKGLDAPKVTLSNSTMGSLTIEAGIQTKASTVTLSNNGRITDESELDNAAVKMTSSHMGDLTLKKGSLTVGGTVNDGSTLGDVELGGDEAVDLKVSGGNVAFGGISGTVSKVELEGATNSYGELDLGDYKSTEVTGNRGLMSGAVDSKTSVNRNWLYGKVTYQIGITGGLIFAGADDFQVLVDEYDPSAAKSNITHLGGSGTEAVVTFNVDGDNILKMNAKPNAVIKLPAKVSTYDTTDWVDGDGTHRPSGYSYVVTGEATLSSLGEYLDVTSITKVAASPAGIKAEVKNGVITLSGALELPGGSGNAASITLTVETNDGTKNTVMVSYFHETKETQFTSVSGVDGANPTVNIDAYTNQLTLQNGAKYGINGSALKKMVSVEIDGISSGQVVVGRVNVPGYTTDAARQILINAIQGTTNGANNSTAVSFSQSPAVQEGLNAAIAAMNDGQVTSWINQAQQNQFNADVKAGTASGKFADQTKPYKGLDKVYVVAYLNMELSVYNMDTTPGTMTMTLTPYYRVEVRSDTTGVDPVVVKAGAALTSLGANWGSTSVKFNVEDGFNAPATGSKSWAHQGSYVYETEIIAGKTVEFSILNGFGSFVLNGVAPKVKLENPRADGAGKKDAVYFDTLQAAVDQAENGGEVAVLDTAYKLEPITLSGVARKFTVNTNGAGAVTATNATGVTVEHETNTHTYTVQLLKDSVAAVTTADISVASGVTNGTVTLSTTRARANTSVEVTTTPAAGYLTSNLTATARTADNKNTTVAVTRTADNRYTFTVPAGATSITVTPTFAINTGLPFTDITADNSYFEAVKYVYNRGMMQGVPAANGATVFDGYSTITRGQVVTILYRLSGSPTASTYSGFNDVPSNQYYAAPITWAYSNGIVQGMGDSQFAPNSPITREQLAKILRDYSAYRGLNITKTTSLTGYSDAGSVHDWAQAGMQWAVGNGIVTGTTTTTLTPGGNAQRFHAATMLMRYCQSFGL